MAALHNSSRGLLRDLERAQKSQHECARIRRGVREVISRDAAGQVREEITLNGFEAQMTAVSP